VPRPTLSKGAVSVVHRAVDSVFDRIKGWVIGPDFVSRRGDKTIFIGHRPEFSIPGIYRQAAIEEATRPDETVLHSLAKVAESYLDAERERTKAKVVKSVQDFLASSKKADLETVLGGELADVWGEVKSNVERIVDSEATTARNMGTLEGISKVAAASGVDDPVVYFVVVRDQAFWECGECPRLHLMPDKITPRAWKLSSVNNGYHKRGEDSPSISGLHPHCRCTLTYLAKGYGFNAAGMVKYVSPDHDEYEAQRGG
jgi:hypothetical protein